jgi:hypothetical protein|tara:strand:+ start:968 stop:1117 length:150 start_codon:yes stop_codon:yes gene_type:complete
MGKYMHTLKPQGSGKGSVTSGGSSEFFKVNVIARDAAATGKDRYNKNGK